MVILTWDLRKYQWVSPNHYWNTVFVNSSEMLLMMFDVDVFFFKLCKHSWIFRKKKKLQPVLIVKYVKRIPDSCHPIKFCSCHFPLNVEFLSHSFCECSFTSMFSILSLCVCAFNVNEISFHLMSYVIDSFLFTKVILFIGLVKMVLWS